MRIPIRDPGYGMFLTLDQGWKKNKTLISLFCRISTIRKTSWKAPSSCWTARPVTFISCNRSSNSHVTKRGHRVHHQTAGHRVQLTAVRNRHQKKTPHARIIPSRRPTRRTWSPRLKSALSHLIASARPALSARRARARAALSARRARARPVLSALIARSRPAPSDRRARALRAPNARCAWKRSCDWLGCN